MHVCDRDMTAFNIPDDDIGSVKKKPCCRKIKRQPGRGFFPPEDLDYPCYGRDEIKGERQFEQKDIDFHV